MGVVDNTPYPPEVEAELAKPAVRVETIGTAEEAAKAWEEAAFKQARRANALRDGLVKLRADIDQLLAASDETDDDKL